jgi:hypothetical protein
MDERTKMANTLEIATTPEKTATVTEFERAVRAFFQNRNRATK